MSEKDICIMESEMIAAVDEYISARPQLDSIHNRRIYESGFKTGYRKLESDKADLQRRLDEALKIIEDSRNQEPVAETGWVGTIRRWFNQKIPGGILLYALPPIAKIPDGMVSVPEEPTEEMVVAGAEIALLSRPDMEGDHAKRIYKAMLQAAKERTEP